MIIKSFLLALAILAINITNCFNLPDYSNPIRNGAEDIINTLPGLTKPINFRQFSGYLPADTGSNPKKFLHYWFVESQTDNPEADPLVLWLNGGPGCSSLLGMFTELGPFRVNEDGRTLDLNPSSWNQRANVLFLESPSGVGFSYSKSVINVHTDDNTAQENYNALKSFMSKFPQYAKSKLYLTGESYAGVYLPTLGVLIDADPNFNLKGIAIGNGFLNAAKLKDSLVFFAYHHGLIGKSTWDTISKFCCQGKPPTRETCSFSGPNSTWTCLAGIAEVNAAIQSGINPYNIYAKCETPIMLNRTIRDDIDRSLLDLMFDHQAMTLASDRKFHVFEPSRKLSLSAPCTDDHLVHEYLNMPEVRKSIHIPTQVGTWSGCNTLVYIMKYPTRPEGLAPQISRLVNSQRKLRLLIYNGDVDAVCNFLGDEWFVDDLELELKDDYKKWKVGGQIAGFYKTLKGLTFATVRGSGHMVPGDRSRESLMMFHSFINSTVDSRDTLPTYETM